MNLLIVASTQMEIAPFLSQSLQKHCDILISGVGVPATSFLLTRQLLHHHYDLVIQAGVAGTANGHVNMGETVLVKKDAFADLGALEQDGFKSIADMELSHEREWIVNHSDEMLNRFAYKKVSAITVNMVTDHKPVIQAFQNKWNQPDIESMEGAALHYICSHLQKPFLQVRTISNRLGERDKTQWKMPEAIENLNKELSSIVKELMN